jgi:hypothetical protein
MAGMDCAVRVLRILGGVPTVKSVYVALGIATVELEESSDEPLLRAIKATGVFTATVRISPTSGTATRVKKLFARRHNESKKSHPANWGATRDCKA